MRPFDHGGARGARGSARRGLSYWIAGFLLLLLVAGLASGQEDARKISLRPYYAAGSRVERRSVLKLNLTVQLLLETPDGNNTHQTDFEMGQRVTSRDEVVESLDGTPRKVRRFFVAHINEEREPGAPKLESQPTTLHQQTLTITQTADGPKFELADPLARIEPEELEGMRLTDPFEAILPAQPVELGSEWVIEGEAFEEIYGKPGKVTCRLTSLGTEKLDEERTIEVADIEISFETRLEAGDLKLETAMTGTMRFDLTGRRMRSLKLEGSADGTSVEKDEEATLTIHTRGPVTLEKKVLEAEKK